MSNFDFEKVKNMLLAEDTAYHIMAISMICTARVNKMITKSELKKFLKRENFNRRQLKIMRHELHEAFRTKYRNINSVK